MSHSVVGALQFCMGHARNPCETNKTCLSPTPPPHTHTHTSPLNLYPVCVPWSSPPSLPRVLTLQAMKIYKVAKDKYQEFFNRLHASEVEAAVLAGDSTKAMEVKLHSKCVWVSWHVFGVRAWVFVCCCYGMLRA